jgi:hypothetical protein
MVRIIGENGETGKFNTADGLFLFKNPCGIFSEAIRKVRSVTWGILARRASEDYVFGDL